MNNREQQLADEIHMGQAFSQPGNADLIAIMLTTEKIRRSLDQIIGSEADLTQQQYNVLRILRGAGSDGLPLLDVAERMIQQSPGMTRMMDRLEKKGSGCTHSWDKRPPTGTLHLNFRRQRFARQARPLRNCF